MEFNGLQHIAITVSDLDRSRQFYDRLFGAEPVLDENDEGGDFHHAVYLIGGGQLFGLHTHTEPRDATIDPRQPGLDHISFACADRGELERWAARLEELGISHGGIKDARYGSGVSFKDPDGIPLEFFAVPS